MADTPRTRAQILALFADNNTGQISEQDLRDFAVTVMPAEFVYSDDFFVRPSSKFITTDASARGWFLYSQYIGSDVSFANVLYQDQSSGYWLRANCSDSAENGLLALAMNSYTSDYSTAIVLLEGVVYYSAWSTTFSRLIGRPIYLASGAPGSITLTEPDSAICIGAVMASEFGESAIGKLYFRPDSWAVKGT